jgi:hypothetical protein
MGLFKIPNIFKNSHTMILASKLSKTKKTITI